MSATLLAPPGLIELDPAGTVIYTRVAPRTNNAPTKSALTHTRRT